MIYDITAPVAPGMAVWPGDSRFGFDWTMRLSGGDTVNVTRLTMSPHTGTHADAFFHVADHGLTMGETPLDAYIGPARVFDAPGDGPIDVGRLEGLMWGGATRLLFKTRRCRPVDPYATPFAHFTPAAVEACGKAGVLLVGLDTPSMDDFHSKSLDAHHALRRHGIANLENLDLTDVPPGDYELIALPLKLMGLDGSPVRAILRSRA
ncbi:MAG: cyclase family protein [Candidatus Eisenbacteria bacterium]|nr:cyclase family protein [Candidatus Eisenbacteria bacterium]